jgi:hypothetical protein
VSADSARRAPEEVLDAVREDRDLGPMEKETTIGFAKDEDLARVFTAEASLTRRLLSHALFEVEELVLAGGGYAESTEEVDTTEDVIVGVRGSVPVACLKVRASRRSRGGHADVVTHPGNSAFKGGEDA